MTTEELMERLQAENRAAIKANEQWLADIERRIAGKSGPNLGMAGTYRIGSGGTDRLCEALPEKIRGQLDRWEVQAKMLPEHERRKRPFSEDVQVKAAAGLWFKGHLIKLTRPGDFDREAQARLTELLGGVQKVALQEDVAAEGGNLVPTILANEILRLIQDNSVVRASGVHVVPMTTKTLQWPVETSANIAAAQIVAEEGTIPDVMTSGPFANALLTAKKIAALATVSGELLQDNVTALVDYLSTRFAELIGRLEDAQALEGDGTGVNFTGLSAAAGVGQVAAENPVGTTTNGGPPRYVQLPKVIGKAAEKSSLDGAVWFMHPQVWANIQAARADAVTAADKAGPPLIQNAIGGLGQVPRSLFGFPVLTSSAILINRTKGTLTTATNIYFGPGLKIILGDLIETGLELNPFSKFSTFQIDVRMVRREGILVGVPAAFTKYTDVDATAVMV